jgi:hypothetical protein
MLLQSMHPASDQQPLLDVVQIRHTAIYPKYKIPLRSICLMLAKDVLMAISNPVEISIE